MSDTLLRPIRWLGGAEEGQIWMLDQRRLPLEAKELLIADHRGVADAIRDMAIRGAPAIGLAAAMGVVLGVREALGKPEGIWDEEVKAVLERLRSTRVTAVNLEWALRRMESAYRQHRGQSRTALLQNLLSEALAIQEEDTAANRTMGELGADLLKPGSRVLTHCNAGALATSAYGTALGVIRCGHARGLVSRVFVDETRPYLQGARLTAWELQRDGILVTLITDSMAGYFMKQGSIDCVIVGSDRIARNGDVANKIGTYSLAVLAKAHQIPFYVAAPTSTIDLETPTGDQIPIEQRSPREVTHIGSTVIAPEGIEVSHPAFDVTPAALVSAIITERGIAMPPGVDTIRSLME
ncbi:MAG: S-methyl-5-thioribose-1-phosphate isomerase [Bradymonadales bacterium]|nr:S-methyl-5-thioribose-1-phosphate isomerase [Bradymonadales bacterium]